MPKAKHTNVKAPHKDAAAKNNLNPPTGGGAGDQNSGFTGSQDQDPKRRIGQFGGAGEPPLIKK